MTIPEESFEFAKNHLKNFFDADFCIKPFEFDAIWTFWDTILPEIQRSLDSFPRQTPLIRVAPKPKGDFRIVHQLDPIDVIVYTAMVHSVAKSIEDRRIPANQGVACSYRILIDESKGSFFNKEYDETYNKRLGHFQDEFEYILYTDITDFYNQVSIHRIKNNLDKCSIPKRDISQQIHDFLINLSDLSSKGIPVGPSASIILAEAAMIDVDDFILTHTENYTRYVDDFNIFSNDPQELKNILHDLTKYLYSKHRLNLSSAKSRIFSTEEYTKFKTVNLNIIEKNRLHHEIRTALNQQQPSYSSASADGEIEFRKMQYSIQVRLIDEATSFLLHRGELDVALGRQTIRRAKDLRIRKIAPRVIENIDLFAPIIRDVILYLDRITNQRFIDDNIDRFYSMLDDSECLHYPYCSEWMKYYFAMNRGFHRYKPIEEYLCADSTDIRIRSFFESERGNYTWITEKQSQYDVLGSWDKRGIINASLIFPRDERKYWLSTIERRGGLLEQYLAKYIKSLS